MKSPIGQHRIIPVLFAVLAFLTTSPIPAADLATGLVAHWKLTTDCQDSSPGAAHGTRHGVTFDSDGWASFDGIGDFIEVPHSKSPALGKG